MQQQRFRDLVKQLTTARAAVSSLAIGPQRDAHTLATSGRYGRDSAIAVMALLLVDLWLVTAAIEAAGRGRRAWEVFDAVAS